MKKDESIIKVNAALLVCYVCVIKTSLHNVL